MTRVQPRPVTNAAETLPAGLRLYVSVDLVIHGAGSETARQVVGEAVNVACREIGWVLSGKATIPDDPNISAPWSYAYAPGDRVSADFKSEPAAASQYVDIVGVGAMPRAATAGDVSALIERAIGTALDDAGFRWEWNAGPRSMDRVGLARADAAYTPPVSAGPFNPDEYQKGMPGLGEMVVGAFQRIGSGVASAAKSLAATVGETAGAAAGGLLSGLGLWVIVLIVALLLFFLLRAKVA